MNSVQTILGNGYRQFIFSLLSVPLMKEPRQSSVTPSTVVVMMHLQHFWEFLVFEELCMSHKTYIEK